jgi:hypothetical protein
MSTLTVKELAAPTGFDLKIASGETLDLKSQGTVTMPTGSVLQVVQGTSESGTTVTSSSFVSVSNLSKSITTKALNSKVLITMNCALQMSQASSNYGVIAIRSSLDSFGASLFEQIIIGRSDWLQLGNVLQFLHSPNQAAGTTITYTAYAKRTSGSQSFYIPDLWGQNTSGVPTSSTTLMEVAQ